MDALLSCVILSGQGKLHHSLFCAFFINKHPFLLARKSWFYWLPSTDSLCDGKYIIRVIKIALYLFSPPALIPISCLFHTLEGLAAFPGVRALIPSLQCSHLEDSSGVCAQCRGRAGRSFGIHVQLALQESSIRTLPLPQTSGVQHLECSPEPLRCHSLD